MTVMKLFYKDTCTIDQANVIKLFDIKYTGTTLFKIFSAFCVKLPREASYSYSHYQLIDPFDILPHRFRVGSIATPFCANHHILSGPEQITCDSMGHWNGTPLCTLGNKNHNIYNFTTIDLLLIYTYFGTV